MTYAVQLALIAVALWLGQRRLAGLREVPTPRPDLQRHKDVSIVIPARNEAASLPRLLASLRSVGAEIVVVDDASTDRTADIAREHGVRLLSSTHVPPGWTGKAWACHQGAQASSRPILLFLDADTELASGALDGLLDLLIEYGGLVSVQPFHHTHKPYEQMSAYFNLVSLMGSGAYALRRPRRPMAFGPCLITSRSDYELAGGHAVVREEILDDAQLAAAYARTGLPVRCFVGGSALRMRMYPSGPRQLAEGWTKNIAAGAGQAEKLSALVTAGWVAAHFAVAAGAVFSAQSVPLGWCVAWVVVAAQLRFLLRRIGSFSWWTWALFPLPLAAFGLLFLRSTIRTHLHRSVRWRERSIELRRTG